MTGIGERFYRETKYPPAERLKHEKMPDEPLDVVKLAPPGGRTKGDLAGLLGSRRSRRKFSGASVGLAELSFLLWAADGLSTDEGTPKYRTAPSAGARHPIDTYVIAMRIEGLEPGVYRYNVEHHALLLFRRGDFEAAAIEAAAGQGWIEGAAAVVVWTGVFARTTERYKDRGYRFVFLDAGHICQNLYLAAEAAGLSMTSIAALIDDAVNALVGADGREESVVYMAAVGARP